MSRDVSQEKTPRFGPGAVLYDMRKPERRRCCHRGGRCLAHITNVYRDIETDQLLYEVWDGTHTTRQYHLGDFPAGEQQLKNSEYEVVARVQ